MRSAMKTAWLSALILLVTSILGANGQWQVIELSTHEMREGGVVKFNSTVDFSLTRPGKDITPCSTTWTHYPTPIIPTQWIKCETDPMLRFRIAVYNDVGNYTLEVVELDAVRSHDKTTSIGVTRANITASTNAGIECFGADTDSGTQCVLYNAPMTLDSTTSTFTPSPLPIVWAESRSDGPLSGDIPCNEAWTFYIYNLNVALLGLPTLGRNPAQWETHCDSNWACGGTDKSVNNWTPCAAPTFQFLKALPAAGGDVLSDFVIRINHTFPLMMATSIRGSNASDVHLTDPEEAAGMQVRLVLEDTAWKVGSTLTDVKGGGIDQLGNCSIGCEYSGKQVSVKVVDMEIL
ncbi:uncharacterized protein LY89DRAFT_670876 [Mollisia scopiformis]|uniref:Uncharacterized protein n=1 Tax=Mollisia scopiformis TaxID=149040 RepID=A0A194X5P8_MOLSC|nr:uncharacterized protein LY89DRAFT_670876 [Mollisia scopiformis]KUJ15399.1 hypothetical protein LY89DRAFT_670876 [Mollisia scopiformis]